MKNSLCVLLILTGTMLVLSIGCNSSRKMMIEADESGNYHSLKNIALKQIEKNPNDPYAGTRRDSRGYGYQTNFVGFAK